MGVYGYGRCDGAVGFFFLFIFIHFGIAVVDDTKRSGFESLGQFAISREKIKSDDQQVEDSCTLQCLFNISCNGQ